MGVIGNSLCSALILILGNKLSGCPGGNSTIVNNATNTSPSELITNLSSTCVGVVQYSRFVSDFEFNFRFKMAQELATLRLQLAQKFFKRLIYESDIQFYRHSMLNTANHLAYWGEIQMRNQTLLRYLNDTCNICNGGGDTSGPSNITARQCVDQLAIESPLMHSLGDILQRSMVPVRESVETTIKVYLNSFSSYILLNSTNLFPELMFSPSTFASVQQSITNVTTSAFEQCCHQQAIRRLQPQNIVH